MLDAEILKAAPQFEVPSGLPELLERAEKFHRRELPGQPMGMHMGTSYLVGDLTRIVKTIPAMVEEIGRLQRELEAANKFMATDAEDYESLRALNAEMATEFKRTIARFRRCLLVAGNTEEMADVALEEPRAIIAKCESQSASAQPRIPGLPAQAPTATSTQPAPRGIIETEKGN